MKIVYKTKSVIIMGYRSLLMFFVTSWDNSDNSDALQKSFHSVFQLFFSPTTSRNGLCIVWEKNYPERQNASTLIQKMMKIKIVLVCLFEAPCAM